MTDTKRFYSGLIYFIVLLLLTVVRIIFALGFGKGFSDNQADIAFTLLSQVVCMGIAPFTLYYLFIIRKQEKSLDKTPIKETLKAFGYRLPSVWVIILSIIAGILLYYLTLAIASVWMIFLTILQYNIPASVGTIYTSLEDMFLWIFIIAVLPGTFEEFSHRGLLMKDYVHSRKDQAVIVSAFLFALMHQNIAQFGYAFIGGIIMAIFYVKSRSIIPPMILHFANNAISTILNYSYQTGNRLGYYYDYFFSLLDNFIIFIIFVSSSVLVVVLLYIIIIGIDVLTAKKLKVRTTWREPFRINLKFSRNDTFLYAAMFLGIITTGYSFIWGVMR